MKAIRWLFGCRGEPEAGAGGERSHGPGHDVGRVLHFTLGPVQGFVAQARRTRDLWAGSFLLSWLSGQAMRVVAEAAGRERFRFPDLRPGRDPLFDAIMGGAAGPFEPGLPNHFVADIPAGKPFDPAALGKAVQGRWHVLAELVWETFVAPCAGTGLDTEKIWRRQIGGADTGPFWEIAWVLVPKAQDPDDRPDQDDWLGRRKLWRRWPEQTKPEAGDMCTLMADWQEISGWSRTQSKPKQEAFWQELRKHVANQLGHEEERVELRPAERLCAIALVKRLFPLLEPNAKLRAAIGWLPGEVTGDQDSYFGPGRLSAAYRPSTGHLAAGRWLQRAWRHARPACEKLARMVADVPHGRAFAAAERTNRLRLLPPDVRFGWLDGRLLFEGSYESATGLEPLAAETRRLLLAQLRAIQETKLKPPAGTPPGPTPADDEDRLTTVGAPSPYYAVLRMDGDQMGKLMAGPARRFLPGALADFACAVRARLAPETCVDQASEDTGRERAEHHAELVYAGGDDLLALLPLENALRAALDVRGLWREKVTARVPEATVSAAILCVHHEVALRWALAESLGLLDDVAKGAQGRDSLAVAVMGRGGKALEWASTWGTAQDGDEIVAGLADLAERSQDQTRGLCANRFAHGLATRLPGVFAGPLPNRGLLLRSEIRATLLSDPGALLRALGGDAAKSVHERHVDALLRLLRPHFRIEGEYKQLDHPLQLDALLLLRFFASQWRLNDVPDACAQAA